jgi:hypothetical protein
MSLFLQKHEHDNLNKNISGSTTESPFFREDGLVQSTQVPSCTNAMSLIKKKEKEKQTNIGPFLFFFFRPEEEERRIQRTHIFCVDIYISIIKQLLEYRFVNIYN